MKKIILWLLQGGKQFCFEAERNGYAAGIEAGLNTDMRLDCSATLALVDTFHRGDSTSIVLQFNLLIYIQFLPAYFILDLHTKRYYL